MAFSISLTLDGRTGSTYSLLPAAEGGAKEDSGVSRLSAKPLTREIEHSTWNDALDFARVRAANRSKGWPLLIPGPVPAESLQIYPGCTVLLGMSYSGKSRLIHHVSQQGARTKTLWFGEPDSLYSSLKCGTLVSTRQELMEEIGRCLFTTNNLVCMVDSLKDFAFESAGATGKGGVNMRLFTQISHFSTVCAIASTSVIVSLNMITDDPLAFKQMREAALGSATNLWVINPELPSTLEMHTKYPFAAERQSHISLIYPGETGAPARPASELVDSFAFSTHSRAEEPLLTGARLRVNSPFGTSFDQQ